MKYGLLIESIGLLTGDRFVHMDDACRDSVEDVLAEAANIRERHSHDTRLVGAFRLDEKTGKITSLYDAAELDEAVIDWQRDNMTDGQRQFEDRLSAAEQRYKADRDRAGAA